MAEANQAGEEDKKNSPKILIIIIVILLLIIVGGVAAFFLMPNNPLLTGGAEGAQAGQNSEGAGEDKKVYSYYEIEQPLRVNFPKGSGANLIEVKVAFLLTDDKALATLKKHEPMIINNLLMSISAAGADKLKTVDGKRALQSSMLETTADVMQKMTGKSQLEDVFFTAFVMQ